MKFTVPQFIEHEAKIVGPLTFKQFIYIGSAGTIAFILFHTIPGPIFWPIAMILGLGALGLAFVKINGRPLPDMIANFFNFLFSSKIYLWQKEKIKTPKTEVSKKTYLKEEKSTKESQLKKVGIKVSTK